jgi:uncharacterized protein (TIGR02147 family)
MIPNKAIAYYTDYRKFLRDYYESRKKKIPHFSYRVLAESVGFSSESFLRMAMEGKKNLTKESAGKIAKALKLNKKASDYFETLVLFNQAKDFESKERFLAKIDLFRKRNNPELLRPKEYDYLKVWLHAVMREVVAFPGFEEDPKKIAHTFAFPVSPIEIQKSLDFLLENGFIERNAAGKLIKKAATIGTGSIPENEELVLIAKKYHLQILDLARSALTDMPRDVRSITATTLSLSQQGYELALKRIETLRYELLELAAAEADVDRICQLTVNLFPLVVNARR